MKTITRWEIEGITGWNSDKIRKSESRHGLDILRVKVIGRMIHYDRRGVLKILRRLKFDPLKSWRNTITRQEIARITGWSVARIRMAEKRFGFDKHRCGKSDRPVRYHRPPVLKILREDGWDLTKKDIYTGSQTESYNFRTT